MDDTFGAALSAAATVSESVTRVRHPGHSCLLEPMTMVGQSVATCLACQSPPRERSHTPSLTMPSRQLVTLSLLAFLGWQVSGFAPVSPVLSKASVAVHGVLAPPSTALAMSDADFPITDDAQERIKALVENHPVLLFMKGSKLFPQCGFSNTAVQILNTFGIEYHSVDVLSDESIRQGVKEFSQWPTIPQLYVCGEFIGGSDIMIEMYQNGELGEMIEKAKADMM